MIEMNFVVPMDVPEEMVETWLENMAAATCNTGRMNLFACDQKIEHLN
ncbi:MAG: aldolase, partial [Euryarchaeota archaeon]|nr:aldolase [Euryarchaeota archaeon]